MKICYLVILCLILIGCSKEQPVETKAGGTNVVCDAVVVSVNGHKLMESELRAKVAMMIAVRRLSGKEAKGEQYKQVKRTLRKSYPKVYVQQRILADYAASEKVEVSKETLKKCREQAISGIKGVKRGYKGVLAKLGRHAAAFDDHVRGEALSLEVRKHILEANATNFPPEYVRQKCADVKAYNARMALTNAVIYARATNVWEQLKAGADFQEMVEKYTEIKYEIADKGEWGTLGLQQMEQDPELAKCALSLKPGEFSPPIEADNGLMIARLDRKDAVKGDYTFSRIYFRLPLMIEEADEKEMLKLLKKEHDARVLQKTLKELESAAKIEYFNRKQNEKEGK